jgi:drug/metabolite transporter (DMT)-like permease
MPLPRAPTRPHLLLTLVILIFGVNYVVGRCLSSALVFGYVHIIGGLFGFLRYFFGALTMGSILLFRRQGSSGLVGQMRAYKRPLALSILASSVFVLSAHQSQAYVSSGTTSVIVNLCPVLVLAYGLLFLKEKRMGRKLAGFALGALGGAFFLWSSLRAGGPGGGGPDQDDWLRDLNFKEICDNRGT